MSSLLQQIQDGTLWDFHGGVHPPENKAQSNQTPIKNYVIPDELVIPVKQHIGTAGRLLVKVGDIVLKGQALTHSDIFQSCPIHAPTSGQITAIEPRTINHPSGLDDLCIVITPDHQDQWIEKKALPSFSNENAETLIEHLRVMGIAGMGGAGFPTARKIQASHGRTEILIINAVECEPYITSDDRLMREYAGEIAQGVSILQQIVTPKFTILAIEDNKPEAIAAMKTACETLDKTRVQVVPTKYPSGGEKQLIELLTGTQVPSQTIPASIGIMMQNVGTVFAIKRAIIDGEPLIQRVVTLVGNTLKSQSNRWALIGTPIGFLLEAHGFEVDPKLSRLIIGGPMMGFTAKHAQIPITKTSNCVLVPSFAEMIPSQGELNCIRCSACAEVCPASLLPQQLYWYAKDNDLNRCQDYQLFDCIECGACAYVCPSEIPLVQYYRQAKAEIRHQNEEAQAADRARNRFEAKKERLERDKKAREEKHRQAAENRRQTMQKDGGVDAVAAAIARVKAKAAEEKSQNAKPAVAAAIARAKAKQAAAKSQSSGIEAGPDNTEMKQLREARKQQARERKASKESVNIDEAMPSRTGEISVANKADTINSSDAKKQAVAAAIARAKAKKAQLAADKISSSKNMDECKAIEPSAISEPLEETLTVPADGEKTKDSKKAAIAAAIERAKQKKAQLATAKANLSPETEAASKEITSEKIIPEAVPSKADEAESQAESIDPKKAAVAAAIARAKARKAAQKHKLSEDE